MDIIFKSDKLRKIFNDSDKATRKYGPKLVKALRRRLDDLRAAEALAAFRNLPGRCHELKGGRKGQLSLDLEHPYRLIFEPANVPVPLKDDGGLNWVKVSQIRIIGIEDTHE